MSKDADDLINAVTDIREDLHDRDETNRGRAIMSRPLPDALDVLRYIDTSRGAAIAHAHALAAGCHDWHLGTANEQFLYRMPGIYGDNFSRAHLDRRELVREGQRVVKEHADETLWAATILADTIERLDPAKDADEIAMLDVLEYELVESSERLRIFLEVARRRDKRAIAALYAAVQAARANDKADEADADATE